MHDLRAEQLLAFARHQFTGTLAIKNGHHPLLEKTNPSASVPNDVFMEESTRLSLLSGREFGGIQQAELVTDADEAS